MTRNVHTFVLCVAGLALGGCYDHKTIQESDIAPIEGDDAGVDQPSNNGGDNGGDNAGDNEGNGDDSGGDNEGPTDPDMGPFGDLDCENPPDRITELLCGLQEGGDSSGQTTGGFPGATTGGRPGGTTGGRPGSTTGGTSGGTTGRPGGTTSGGFPGLTSGMNVPTDPAEIIQEIIDNLDCDAKEPDFLTQILCQLTMGGTGFPGGGGGSGGGGTRGGGTRGGNTRGGNTR